MKDFKTWINEAHYDPNIDGPPLRPMTIAQAEAQIRELATYIRTTFGVDPRFTEHKSNIFQATQSMEGIANQLTEGMGDDLRNQAHRFG